MTVFLQFQQVTYSYSRQEGYALKDLSFSIDRGEFLGILGADDAGKTTIAKLTNGLLLPSKGSIILTNTQKEPPTGQEHPFRYNIGVVFSDPENQIVGTTVAEDVAFGLGNLRVPSHEMRIRVETYLERVDLLKYAKRSPRDLSGGEQQKLCLAGVLAMEPECLVLDEPLTFLNTRSRRELLQLLVELNADGKTILYLTSDPEELLYTHRILLLHQGMILTQYPTITLWNTPSVLEKAGVLPSDMMLFRKNLRQRGYPIKEDSLTPETIVSDILNFL